MLLTGLARIRAIALGAFASASYMQAPFLVRATRNLRKTDSSEQQPAASDAVRITGNMGRSP